MKQVLLVILAGGCEPGWFMDTEGEKPEEVEGPTGDAPEEDSEESESESAGTTGTGFSAHMPFHIGYNSMCTQGPGGATSHFYNSTRYDVDFDTPNFADDLVFAPAGGVAFVHDDGAGGFGRHVNLALGDGTYLVLGHLKSALVGNGEEVAEGQILGFEGTTGASSGDHVHYGRHLGDASRPAGQGASIPDLRVFAYNVTRGRLETPSTEEMVCALPGGHTYRSTLPIAKWHPDGTLVKTPSAPEVYIVEDRTLRHIADEATFHGNNWNFADVALISTEERECYDYGPAVTRLSNPRAWYRNGELWLVVGEPSAPDRYRVRVPNAVWREVLATWGITALAEPRAHVVPEGESLSAYPAREGYAKFREGSLVKEYGVSTVYAIEGATAVPIASWDAYLLLDFATRRIVEVPQGAVESVMPSVGDCALGECITTLTVTSCSDFEIAGGPTEEEEVEDTAPPEDTGTAPDTETDSDTEATSDTGNSDSCGD